MAEKRTTSVVPNRVDIFQETRMVADMTDTAAEAYRHRADADVKIAEATHAIPAKQETLKVVIVVGAVSALTLVGVLTVPSANVYGVIVTGLLALAGLWGVPEAIKKLRKPA